jgi:hypothetical protein
MPQWRSGMRQAVRHVNWLSAACDVGPGAAQGAVSVATGGVAMVRSAPVTSSRADVAHVTTVVITVNEWQTISHRWVTTRGLMGYICTGGDGNGVRTTRETERQFEATEGPGAAQPGQVAEVVHRTRS